MKSVPTAQPNDDAGPQLEFNFEEVIEQASIFTRDDIHIKPTSDLAAPDYDPVAQTSEYMLRAVRMEEAWETTVQKARLALLKVDPRELYLSFFRDLKKKAESGSAQSERYARLLETVAIRGLGIHSDHLRIRKPAKGGTRWRIDFDATAIQKHVREHVVGRNFINILGIDGSPAAKEQLLIAASDVSQHRSAVPIPAKFFKRSVPFVLNNAAGAMWRHDGEGARYENIFNPKPDENLLRWMLVDPSYQDELSPEDYERCIASAMDVGQYKFDLEFLLKSDRPPTVIFRDGSLFPQDAYLDNYVMEGRRGDFTREAIRDLLACLLYAREVGTIYCGVSKNVQLKVYSAIVDWFISKEIDKNWEVGQYTLNDGQAMSILLASPEFAADNLNEVAATCLVRRSFTTRANINTRNRLGSLESYFDSYQTQHPEISIKPFASLCELAHMYMFFIGHSKSPQQQLPRYEFFHSDSFGAIEHVALDLFAALRHCGLTSDHDHSFMADKPITFLLPSVTQQAHVLSKDVGRYIDSATGQWIMARYRSLIQKA